MEAISIGTLITAIVALLASIISAWVSIRTNNRNNEVLREVEYLKNKLQKENIAYQIYHTELAKRKFEAIENLHQVLCRTIDYIIFQFGGDRSEEFMTEDEKKLVSKIEKDENGDGDDLLEVLMGGVKELFAIDSVLEKNKIYLKEDLYYSIRWLLTRARRVMVIYYNREKIETTDYEELTKKLNEYNEQLISKKKEVEKLLKSHLSVMEGYGGGWKECE